MKDYVDTGKVRWVFHNFAFLSQDSLNAAEATYCANDQNKFWQLEDVLYANQGAESATTFSKDQLKKLAAQAGLDTAAFNQCLDSGKYTAQINKDSAAAQAIGVQGTPTFFINGQQYGLQGNNGPSILSTFRARLDQELAKQ
jgi:protein-disulfide isomerase